VSLHFAIAGTVQACCENGKYDLGDVRTDTLDEIWHGPAREEMVAALARGDYPLGCELCEVEHAVGNRASTPAPPFDYLVEGEWPPQLEFTLSNRCNLACTQCSGLNSSTIRSKREHLPPLPMPYRDAFFEQLVPFLEHVQVVTFLGGEPFLTPEAKRVWDLLIEHDLHPRVQVTTNATVWSADVERYVNALKMDFAISIDGATAETYDAIRVGARFDRTMAIRDRLIEAARGYGGRVQINWCLMPANWHEVGLFLLEADRLDVDANLIPVFAPSDQSLFALGAAETAAIVARLGEQDLEIRDQLGRNRPAWDGFVRMLREHHQRLHSSKDREARLAAIEDRRRARAEAAAAGALVELQDWAGRPCIEIRTTDGRIDSVDAPAWAARLGADRWVGHELTSLTDWIADSVGPVEAGDGGGAEAGGLVVCSTSWVQADEGPIEFRSAYLPYDGRLLLVSADLD
jgi:MoaA/NifB/PqqE/SkfB family radical SAM enzyme